MEKLYGNAIIGQSGGPTTAINATLCGVIRGVKENLSNGQIHTLYGMRNGIEGLLEEKLIDLTSFFDCEEKLFDLEHTPSAALGSCRKKLPPVEKGEETYEKILSIFKKYDIRYFFYIGGNDSMDTVAKLSAYMEKNQYKMRIIGIPKTIDNDLIVTDHTPGFGSAAKYICVTMQEILRDCAVYTIPAVTIVEIMGRDAGWLTASAGIPLAVEGKVPDLIYLPERAFDMQEFFADVREALKRHPNVVVAVSEGIRDKNGTYVCEGYGVAQTDAFGHKQLSGTGKALEYAVKKEIGCKVRSVELNISQRCASHLASKQDILESVRVGKESLRFACSGESGKMAIIVRNSTAPYSFTVSLEKVENIANQIKHVPESFINERGNHITKECAIYLLPLIFGEASPRYENGLPKFIIL